METTDIGLIVPHGTISKKRTVIIREHAKTIQKAMGICLREGLQLLLVCPLCEPAGREAIVTPGLDAQTNELLLECGCTVRLLEHTTIGRIG